MREYEAWLILAALVGFALGGCGILWVRIGKHRTTWGRAVFIAAILFLGAGSMFAAFHRADALVPFGLAAGFLVVGMLALDPAAGWSEPVTPYIEN